MVKKQLQKETLIYSLFPFEKVLSFHMVLMGEDFKVVNLFSLFMYNPLKIEWMWPFIWTNLSWIHFSKGCFVSRLIKIGLAQWFWRRFFLTHQYIFIILLLNLWKYLWPFFRKNLNSLYQTMLRSKFAWNWPSGSG